MRPAPKRLSYEAVPRGTLQITPWLWVLWSVMLLSAIGALVALLLTRTPLASYRSYVGELRPNSAPAIVQLPSGVFVERILVERSEDVQKGQTVITLDKDALTRKLDSLEHDLLHDRVLRDCLLSHPSWPLLSKDKAADYDADTADSAQHTEHPMTVALEICETHRTREDDIQQSFEAQQEVLEKEKFLIEHYIRLLTNSASAQDGSAPPQQDGEQKSARQALALAIARNKLEERIMLVQQQARQDLADLRAQQIARVQSLNHTIRTQEALQKKLEYYRDNPRLQTPASGRVVRVRQIPRDVPMAEDTDVIEVRPKETLGYTAHFLIPPEHARGIESGAQVRLQIFGLPDQEGLLHGTVGQMTLDTAGRLRAEVALTQDSVAKLDDPQTGIALRGPGTASMIYVRKRDVDVLQELLQELRNGLLHKPFSAPMAAL